LFCEPLCPFVAKKSHHLAAASIVALCERETFVFLMYFVVQIIRYYSRMNTVEIICSQCGADTLIKREAIYDGFAKVGEKLSCSTCGHEYASEADVPFNAAQAAAPVFSDADRSVKVDVFDEGENKRICRYCAHYIINPFTQFCATRKTEVQATDSCNRFAQAIETNEGNALL